MKPPVPGSKGDYFGTYLETVKSLPSTPTVTPAPMADARATADEPSFEVVLKYLGTSDRPTIAELATGIGASLITTALVVSKLSASNLVVVDGGPGQERLSLTASGRQLSA